MTTKPPTEFFSASDFPYREMNSPDPRFDVSQKAARIASAKVAPLIEENARLGEALKVAEDLVFNIGIAASAVLNKNSTAKALNPAATKLLTDNALASIARIMRRES